MTSHKGAPCRLEDCPMYDLLGTSTWRVQGHSNAGERSGYYIHGLNVVVDCGLSTYRTPAAVFLTHRHTDHSFSLPNIICARTIRKQRGRADDEASGGAPDDGAASGAPVFMPPECIPIIAHLCASVAWLSDGVLPPTPEAALRRIGISPIGVQHGRKLSVPGVPGLLVEVIAAHHGETECNGYGFIELRRKLRPEFQGLPGAEIASLRKAGTDVMMYFEIPRVLIYGDTTPDALLLHDEWKRYPNVFIECTGSGYVDDAGAAAKEVQSRRERFHSHINELLPILERNSDGRRWFVQHTSLAISVEAVRNTLSASAIKDWVLISDDSSAACQPGAAAASVPSKA